MKKQYSRYNLYCVTIPFFFQKIIAGKNITVNALHPGNFLFLYIYCYKSSLHFSLGVFLSEFQRFNSNRLLNLLWPIVSFMFLKVAYSYIFTELLETLNNYKFKYHPDSKGRCANNYSPSCS
jgi:hypothetical protein